MRLFSVITITFLSSCLAYAYPEFIGYGYSSCLTCHVNGQGSGPLNDYGRALWSAEIAGKLFYSKSTTDEEMAAQSGFLGKVELPYWIRPHAKYRAINLRRSPGSSQDTTKFYQMQADVGLTLQADEDGRFVAVGTWGNLINQSEYLQGKQGFNNIYAREHYLRIEAMKSWWIYAGLLEKVFGLRNIDHTSYQRTYQGFNVTTDSLNGIAQSQGLILQKVEEKWEASVNYFIGNPRDSESYKQKGLSFMGEYEIREKARIGSSFLDSKSDLLKKRMLAFHYRQGLSKGSALMFEYGFIENETQTGTISKTTGSYNLIEGLFLLTRGYNFHTTVERYNEEFKPEKPDRWKYSLGLLMFPLPRLELRADLVNSRDISNQRAADDNWAIQGQAHVSL